MASFKLRRFSNPAVLKAISRPLLVRFLEPHQDFLARRDFALHDPGGLDYDALAAILMSPDEHTPDGLLDALFFVDEMSTTDIFEGLVEEAEAAGIDLGPTDDLSPGDLAVRVWLADRNILERLHAERFLVRPKSFHSFLSTEPCLGARPNTAAAAVAALEVDLNDWFETKKRGRGTRAFPFEREGSAWFLVRHGEPYKREGTITDGESSSIYYRPEKFDVLIYNPEIGELAIHAVTKGEKLAYCRTFGKHLFGSESFFDIEGADGKFTLQPIIDDWRACVACMDIDGIEDIRLTELQFRHDAAQYHVEVHKADEVFSAMEDIDRRVPPKARLLKAGFKVKFAGAARPRTVVIRPPNLTIFDRESDAELLNLWMERRGFIQPRGAGRHADADTVLGVA